MSERGGAPHAAVSVDTPDPAILYDVTNLLYYDVTYLFTYDLYLGITKHIYYLYRLHGHWEPTVDIDLLAVCTEGYFYILYVRYLLIDGVHDRKRCIVL